MSYLKTFFVVTMTSVYEVGARGENGQPFARKIMLKAESNVKTGETLSGPMLSVGRCLQFFVPEGGGMTSFERRLEKVNTGYWGGHSSSIVALFLSQEEAKKCLRENINLKPGDCRWRKQTEEVMGLIGEDHPTISLCHYEGLALVFEEAA